MERNYISISISIFIQFPFCFILFLFVSFRFVSLDLKHSYDNKENVPGIQSHHGSTSEYRLDSPKYTLQPNSPNTPLSSYKSPPSTHSSPMYTAHEIRNDCNFFTYSPLITEPYKHSTYFHFPDVDTPSSINGKASQQQQQTPRPTSQQFSMTGYEFELT